MGRIDQTYEGMLQGILKTGFTYPDPNRKGVNRIQVPSMYFSHDLSKGFPALTSKKLYWKAVMAELLWFLRGQHNIRELRKDGITIWDKDAYNHYKVVCKNLGQVPRLDFQEFLLAVDSSTPSSIVGYEYGDLGPIYGKQWRDSGEVDQIQNLINNMRKNVMNTSLIVNAWNVQDLEKMGLKPCHFGFQILGQPLENGKHGFHLQWWQRSVDTFLGLPFNIASYGSLAHILELMTGHKALSISGILNNIHIYDEHMPAVKEQLTRDIEIPSPTLKFSNDSYNSDVDWTKMSLDAFLDELHYGMFELEGYNPSNPIKAEMLPYNK